MLTNVGAGSRHGIILADKAHSVCIPSFTHKSNITGYVYTGRTQRYAGNRVLQRSKAAVVLHMIHVIIIEALEAAQNQLCRIASNGAISRGDNRLRRFLNGFDGLHCAGAVENFSHQCDKLAKSNTTRHTFAA